MTGRQGGMPLSQMRREVVTWQDGVAEGAFRDAVANLLDGYLIDAYELPRYSSPENQQSAVRDFTDAKYLECLKFMRIQEQH